MITFNVCLEINLLNLCFNKFKYNKIILSQFSPNSDTFPSSDCITFKYQSQCNSYSSPDFIVILEKKYFLFAFHSSRFHSNLETTFIKNSYKFRLELVPSFLPSVKNPIPFNSGCTVRQHQACVSITKHVFAYNLSGVRVRQCLITLCQW